MPAPRSHSPPASQAVAMAAHALGLILFEHPGQQQVIELQSEHAGGFEELEKLAAPRRSSCRAMLATTVAGNLQAKQCRGGLLPKRVVASHQRVAFELVEDVREKKRHALGMPMQRAGEHRMMSGLLPLETVQQVGVHHLALGERCQQELAAKLVHA